MDLNVQNQPIDALIPYARNARTHSPEQVAEIAASIKEFGFNNPVLLRDDNTIIAGHGRVLAARKLGMVEVPCIYLSHLTEAQARAYVLADNQLATHAGWEADMLKLELDDLSGLGFDPELLGFNDADLAALISHGETDIAKEWGGMPEFEQPDATAFRSLIVHFNSEEDVEEFKKSIGQDFTEKTKFIYYPRQIRADLKAIHYE
jgi:ParB-like chromosome segregation protein Spo0J